MLKKTLLCLTAALFVLPASAQVYKWKDADGNIHYEDAPSSAGAGQVEIKKQTEEQIANGKRLRAETEKAKRALEDINNSNRQNAAVDSPPPSGGNPDTGGASPAPTPMRRY